MLLFLPILLLLLQLRFACSIPRTLTLDCQLLIDEILQQDWGRAELDKDLHALIGWLFPIREHAKSRQTFLLNPCEIRKILNNVVMMRRLVEAYAMSDRHCHL